MLENGDSRWWQAWTLKMTFRPLAVNPRKTNDEIVYVSATGLQDDPAVELRDKINPAETNWQKRRSTLWVTMNVRWRTMFSGNMDSTNVDIRLALSGTTTLLIIALLVFMVHRLRQRRLLIIMRRKGIWLCFCGLRFSGVLLKRNLAN